MTTPYHRSLSISDNVTLVASYTCTQDYWGEWDEELKDVELRLEDGTVIKLKGEINEDILDLLSMIEDCDEQQALYNAEEEQKEPAFLLEK